jgi:NAD(P)-dependent dehydrogenase (short-subunit alcohol dehydrogenase family)
MMFKGRVAVITGGETGIGRASVELLAAQGMRVVIGGILAEPGAETVHAVEKSGGQCEFHAIDVREVSQINALIDDAVRSYGRLDVMINNAAVFDGFASCLDTSDALWQKVLDINLRGTFFGCRAALRHMVPAGKGRIINVSSIGGLRGGADGASYTASKFGIVGLTRQLACDYAQKGIAINAVCPGSIVTGVRENSLRILGDDAPPMRGVGSDPDAIKRLVPAQRKGTAVEIANMISFLASDQAEYIHGQALAVDGGWSAT